MMSHKTYTLKIECEDPVTFSRLVNQDSTKLSSEYWEYELVEEEDSDSLQQLIDFYRKVKRGIPYKIEDAIIWILYEYDQQCNLEFNVEQMKQLSELGIHLCISCWER